MKQEQQLTLVAPSEQLTHLPASNMCVVITAVHMRKVRNTEVKEVVTLDLDSGDLVPQLWFYHAPP